MCIRSCALATPISSLCRYCAHASSFPRKKIECPLNIGCVTGYKIHTTEIGRCRRREQKHSSNQDFWNWFDPSKKYFSFFYLFVVMLTASNTNVHFEPESNVNISYFPHLRLNIFGQWSLLLCYCCCFKRDCAHEMRCFYFVIDWIFFGLSSIVFLVNVREFRS